jgi:hypothetical protein
MDSQGEDSPSGAPLQDCCTEWILKVRIDLVEQLFRNAAQNGFSALLQDCCTEWILKVRTAQVEHLFRTAAQNGFSR